MLVLLPTSSSKLLAKWQGPFVVTRRVGELDYEVRRTDRGDACQIYHLNLLKRWNEGTSVGLAVVVSNEDDLGSLWSPGGITCRRGSSPTWPSCKQILRMCFHPCPVARTSYSTTSKRSPGKWRVAAPIAFRNTRKTWFRKS